MRTAGNAAALACASVPALSFGALSFGALSLGTLSLGTLSLAAAARVVVGARVFPVALTFDDPGVGDEAPLPAFTHERGPAAGGTGPTHREFGIEAFLPRGRQAGTNVDAVGPVHVFDDLLPNSSGKPPLP